MRIRIKSAFFFLLLVFVSLENDGAKAELKSPLSEGRFEVINGQTGVVIAAPHADSDLATGDIVKAILKGKPFGGVIVWGFRNGKSWKDRFNVNRPTEKAAVRCDHETMTQEAHLVYNEYRRNILLASPEDLSLLVEFHGNSTQKQIEIATVRVTLEEASRLKKAYDRLQTQYLATNSNLPRVGLLIEPLDTIKMVARCVKTKGIFQEINAKVIHIEMPRNIRTGAAKNPYVSILAGFIDESASILVD